MIAHQYQGGHPPSFGFPHHSMMHGPASSMMLPPSGHYAPQYHLRQHQHSSVPMQQQQQQQYSTSSYPQRQLKNDYNNNGYYAQQHQYSDTFQQQQQYNAMQQARQQQQGRGDNILGRSWSVYNNDSPYSRAAAEAGAEHGERNPAVSHSAAASHQGYSSSSLNEERAHLDRLFSALTAAHPNPTIHHQHQHHAAHTDHGNAYHHAHEEARAHAFAQAQSRGNLGHPFGGETTSVYPRGGLLDPCAASTSLSLPQPPHHYHHHHQYPQATGLQPAFDFGPALSKNAFGDEKAVEASLLPVSAVRYHEAMLEQERRSVAAAQQQAQMEAEHQRQQQDIAAAAAWADYAVQQQQQQQQLHHAVPSESATGMAQMELADLVLPGKEITLDDEPELIPKDASAIPPPPAIEKSAYPLAALATDLVWEAFISASSSATSSTVAGSGQSPSMPCTSGSQSPMYRTGSENRTRGGSSSPFAGFGGGISTHLGGGGASQNSGLYPRTPSSTIGPKKSHLRSTSKSLSPSSHFGSAQQRGDRATSVPKETIVDSGYATPATGNVYGAIGGERKPARNSNKIEQQSPASSSSPASSVPGTPDSNGNMGCIVKTGSDASLGSKMAGKRLSAGAINWLGYSDEVSASSADSFSNANKDIYSAALLKNPTGQQHQQQHSKSVNNHNLAPPTALFEQIQKLLCATLLSQQVLLLALYFVAKTPHTCPLYPPATSQSALKSTSAPFKLLLAALVVANKHLDDNSFRNSTFAQVANVTLPEVNALEFSMLSSLEFDINVPSSDWLAWLRDLQYHRTTRFPIPDQHQQQQVLDVASIVTPIIEGVLAHQEEHARLFKSPVPSSSPTMKRFHSMPDSAPYESSVKTKVPCVSSTMMTSEDDGVAIDETTSAYFDLDAAGPLEVEQRPRYNKAFGATVQSSSPSGFNFGGTRPLRQSQDEAMLSTAYVDGQNERSQYGTYNDWDMPEDPYASHVPF